MFLSQLPCLSSYDSYCSNQVAAKALLDHKKQDHRVQDFLQRCLESPFSRKLDLWNFLDIPRSRLVKYPLLLREILRHTPNDNPDQQHLEEAVSFFLSPLGISPVAVRLGKCVNEGSLGTRTQESWIQGLTEGGGLLGNKAYSYLGFQHDSTMFWFCQSVLFLICEMQYLHEMHSEVPLILKFLDSE